MEYIKCISSKMEEGGKMKVVLEPTKELLIVMCGSNHFSKHKDDPHFFPEQDDSDKPWEMTTAKAS